MSQPRQRFTLKIIRAGLPLLAALPLVAQSLSPQNSAAPTQVPEMSLHDAPGAIEVTAESFLAGPASYSAQNTSGISATISQYIPAIGAFRATLEGFYYGGKDRDGRSFAELSDVRFRGRRYTFRVGDFSMDAHPLHNTIATIQDPFLTATGLQVDSDGRKLHFSVFAGLGDVLGGTRIPLRFSNGQSFEGMKLRWEFSKSLSVGIRGVRLSQQKSSDLFSTNLLPAAWTTQISALWEPGTHLHLYGEGGISKFEGALPVTADAIAGGKWSGLAGIEWKSPSKSKHPLDIHGYYLLQNSSTLPVAGYFSTGRKGWFYSWQYQIAHWITLSASTSKLNLDFLDAATGLVRTQSGSAGVSLSLPGRVSVSGQYSSFSSASTQLFNPRTQVSSISAMRPFGRQSLRLEIREVQTSSTTASTRTNEAGLDDNFRIGRLSLLAGARWRTDAAQVTQSGLTTHGMVQLNLSRLSVYGYFENGADHFVKSGLSSDLRQTSNGGVRWDFTRNWSVSADAVYSNLALSGVTGQIIAAATAAPTTDVFSTKQWYGMIRVTRRLSWGGNRSVDDVSAFSAARTPLTGLIGGQILSKGLLSSGPAANVTVMLDDWIATSTNTDGFYTFPGVPQGPHKISVDLRRLPVDYELLGQAATTTTVIPMGRARVDFSVRPLAAISGHVIAPEGLVVADIVVRAGPGDHWTTTDDDGHFLFSDLPEGDYDITIEATSLPEQTKIKSSPLIKVHTMYREPPKPIVFELVKVPFAKPTRNVPLRQASIP